MTDIDLEFVKTVAREAGTRALSRINSLQREFKADNSYVTDVDRDVETYVREQLEGRYPDFAFLGEEFGRHGAENAPLWAVDPIDGTTNMVFGLPFWCVSIGLLVEGKPVAGALYFPRTEELFYGQIGQGAFCNGVRLQPPDRESIHPEDTLGFTSGSIKNLNPHVLPGRIRCLGSIAGDIAYTARGTYCSLVGWNEGAYDMAAALCLAHEAGCISEYLTGEPLDLNVVLRDGKTRQPFVVAPPKMAALLQRELKRRE